MLSEPFNRHEYITFGTRASQVTRLPSTLREHIDEYRVTHITGISVGHKGIYSQKLSHETNGNPKIDDMRYSLGEWAAVATRKNGSQDEFVVFADSYGYCPVFYALTPDGLLVVSDTFQGVAAGLENSGIQRSLDVENYVATIVSNIAQFQNAFSERTMAANIKKMMPGDVLHISNAQVSINTNGFDKLQCDLEEYDTLLDKAIDLSNVAIRAISELPDASRRLTLSGGVDSRLTLALLVKAGCHREFKVFSMDPRTWSNPRTRDVIERDVTIANAIREDFGLEWWQPGERKAISLDFKESLAAFQSYRSNFAYTFKPSSLHTIHSQKNITVRGGGGEILRSTAGGRAMSSQLDAETNAIGDSIESQAEWLAARLVKKAHITDGFTSSVRSVIAESFMASKGENFEERMNSFYFMNRNRAHFGHSRHSLSANDQTIQLLSNPYFMEASNKIHFKDRSQGNLVADVFARTAPELLSYPFEDPIWTKKLAKEPLKALDISNENWKASYDKSKKFKSDITFLQGWNRGDRREHYSFDPEQSSANYVAHGFSLIESFAPPELQKGLAEQHQVITQALKRRSLDLYGVVAKVGSALDVVLAQAASYRVAAFHCNPLSEESNSSKILVISKPSMTSDGISNVPVFEQSPKIEKTKKGFIIKSNPQGPVAERMTHAFYLLKDGKRVAQRWYEESPFAEFEGNFDDGSYSGISFARYEGSASPTYQFPTNKLVLPLAGH